jgi:hypothetical protein
MSEHPPDPSTRIDFGDDPVTATAASETADTRRVRSVTMLSSIGEG